MNSLLNTKMFVSCIISHSQRQTTSSCSCRGQHLFKPKPGEVPKDNKFYRRLYPQIIQDIDVSFRNLHVDFCTQKRSRE